jgi:hypothetical protein
MLGRAGGPVHQLTAAIGANVIGFVCASSAKSAFETANKGARRLGR